MTDFGVSCPHCGITGTITVVGDIPEGPDGRPVLCRGCGEWAVFASEDRNLHLPDDKAMDMIVTDRDCQKAKLDWQNEHNRGVWE